MNRSSALLVRWLGVFALGIAVMSGSVLMAVCGGDARTASRSAGTDSPAPLLNDRLPSMAISPDLSLARSDVWTALALAFSGTQIYDVARITMALDCERLNIYLTRCLLHGFVLSFLIARAC